MKLNSKKSRIKKQKPSDTEIKKAFRWIESFSEKGVAKLNPFVKVQVAQELLAAYRKRIRGMSKKKK